MIDQKEAADAFSDLPQAMLDASVRIQNSKKNALSALRQQFRDAIVSAFQVCPDLGVLSIEHEFLFGEVDLNVYFLDTQRRQFLPNINDLDYEGTLNDYALENAKSEYDEYVKEGEADEVVLAEKPEYFTALGCIARADFANMLEDGMGGMMYDNKDYSLHMMFPNLPDRPNVSFEISREEALTEGFDPETYVPEVG